MINKKIFLALAIILALLFSLVACDRENDTTNTDTNTTTDTDISYDTDTDIEEEQSYFVATINKNTNVISSPYTNDTEVSEELKGIYYSASSPGGKPRNDGTGKIYLTLKPVRDICISKIVIDGEYSSVENLGNDLYCIHGVKSNLTVSTYTSTLIPVNRKYFKDYGYGISDEGKLTVTWIENENEPLRYVELSYTDKNGRACTEYIDAKEGKKELFDMVEGEIYTVSIRAIAEKRMGQKYDISCCYMTEPKEVNFPRIEITTENFIWPECDFVGSPEECWGAGITNAFYEQCVMTLYNENNEIVYTSSQNGDFNGAKLKIRGNTSAKYSTHSRFPYKLKLDKKFDLLEPIIGRKDSSEGYADRDWVLLNYGNDGYRICGDAISDAVGTEWSPDYCYVSLYLNGEFRGLYVLSEAVEEGNEGWRVNVDNDGYVFECDAYWWNEDYYFSTPMTENTPMYYTFKYPDPDDKPDYTYLRDYIIKFEEALQKDDDSYLDYIDLDSFVKWLLVSDYLCINDGGGCNIFLYKKNSTDDTKLCMGPNWDFDSYMGSVDGLSVIRMKWDGAPFYYQYLIEKESFQKRYIELFNETCDNLTSYVNDAFSKIDTEAHTQLLMYSNERFGISKTTLQTRKERFLEYLNQHLAWMEKELNIQID